MRTAEVQRRTEETYIEVKINLDGSGKAEIATGIGFLDHMLTLLCRHALFDLTVKAQGDLHIDAHHTTEDCGIVFGQALKAAVGDKSGLRRYGSCVLPMDEALALVALDFSGRALTVWQAEIPKVALGSLEAETIEEFFRALVREAGLTLHVRLLSGDNVHHMLEAIFKAFARALAEAVVVDSRITGVMSTKGSL